MINVLFTFTKVNSKYFISFTHLLFQKVKVKCHPCQQLPQTTLTDAGERPLKPRKDSMSLTSYRHV